MRLPKDSLRRGIAVNRLTQQIVSLSPSHTETLFALGLEAEVVEVTL